MLQLRELDLNLLHTFQVFVGAGSVHGTARILGRSQPAISARLHQLQRELGVDLFERCGRRLVLTPAGRAFDRRSTELIPLLQTMVDEARAGRSEPSGVLRIAALPTVGVFVLAPKLPAFRDRHPQVEFQLDYTPRDPADALRSGEVDMVLGVGASLPTAVHTIVVGHARPVLVTARSAGVSRRRPLSVRALRSMAWVGYERRDDPFFGRVWRYLEEHGLADQVSARVSHIQTLKMLVRHGGGVTILPDYTVVEPDLATHRVAGLDFSLPIWAAVRHSSMAVPAVVAFAAALAERSPRPKRAHPV